MARRSTLSLSEWAVLGVLVERPRHGYDIAAALRPGSALGDTWRVSRPLVYRALERLVALGLVAPGRTEPGEGPPRTVHAPTRRGRAALLRWLDTPVAHLRDVRSALLLKLALAERLGRDRTALLRAQQAAFAPLFDRLGEAERPGTVTDLWRRHSAAAAAAFLDALGAPATGGRPGSRRSSRPA